jgi:hypothetical protein
MSAKIMGQVWELKLPHAHMLVLLALADHADHQGGNIYPGVKLIAWKCGYSERQVQRIMQDLVEQGLLIEVESEPGKATVYRVDLSVGEQKTPYKGRQNVTTPRQNVRGDKMSGVTKLPEGGDILAGGGVTFSTADKAPNTAPERPKVAQTENTNRHVEPSREPRESERNTETPHSHAAMMYFEVFPSERLTANQIATIDRRVTGDYPRWQRALNYWSENGFNAQRIGKICDRYGEEAHQNSDGRSPPDQRPPLPTTPYQPPTDALSRAEIKQRLKEHLQR